MSSWLDLIDDASLDRFVAGDGGGQSNGRTRSGRSDDHDDDSARSASRISEVLVPSPTAPTTAATAASIAYGTANSMMSMSMVSNSSILDDDDDDEDGLRTDASEITILPSVSSSEHALVGQDFSLLLQERFAPTRSSILIAGEDDDEDYVSVDNGDDMTSSLSLHPESVVSSVMTDLSEERMMISSVSSDEGTNKDECDDDVSIQSEQRSLATTVTVDNDVNRKICPGDITNATVMEDTTKSQWYGRFQTEQDWEEFRSAAHTLLQAVDDCPAEERDQLIAQLIAEEEDMFWDRTKKAGSSSMCVVAAEPSKSWLLEVVAVVATVALTGVALVRILKGR